MSLPELSVTIPVFNEEDVLPGLFDRLHATLSALEVTSEIILVDDGSTDRSPELLRQFWAREPRCVLVRLSRNFGHQASITAGLQAARGRCVVVMDADLQDPPELIPELVARWREGYEIVMAQRRLRHEPLPRRVLFDAFYKVLGLLSDYPIPMHTGVFGLMDRKVVAHLLEMTERNRFLPGMRSWLGFRQTVVSYDRSDRAAGQPKQSVARLFRYGFDAVFGFSYKPLRASWVFGLVVSVACFAYAFTLLVLRILGVNVVRGFTTPTVAILFIGGVQLVAIGILGEYLGRIYDEVKRRPLFVVREECRHASTAGQELRAGS